MVLVLEYPVLLGYSLQLTPGQKSFEENYGIGIIYFDFAKAFDSVPHKYLLVKPESYGIFGNLLGWLRSFLFGGRQKVVVNGQSSCWCDMIISVPQGSILSPLLFTIYVNDTALHFNSNILQLLMI